ncbi:MAG: hypothetical protein JWP44_5073 [Mucilaginibacter sp.]|nr:hypothetical protein [Mucilaginibacter sp.]
MCVCGLRDLNGGLEDLADRTQKGARSIEGVDDVVRDVVAGFSVAAEREDLDGGPASMGDGGGPVALLLGEGMAEDEEVDDGRCLKTLDFCQGRGEDGVEVYGEEASPDVEEEGIPSEGEDAIGKVDRRFAVRNGVGDLASLSVKGDAGLGWIRQSADPAL